ncbi:nuclear transport factor 2 isoform X3 [Hevea brasiliensis]|uniref:nuclear transport factor 2 isoform X3 n=1 Tax=Hevea brasiliensis TaxID=3981 RepID=UPI0025D81A31|nr:nuclear transport factor 2 isoform X3 [Hevea brasiliensis]
MALQSASNPTTPSAQVVGNAFVEQYYHILHTSPELVYRFYQDSSVLSRPDANGVMTSVATMQGINEKILSLNFKDYKAEIKTADAQKSYKEGVTVLVTGCLMGQDNLRRKFSQSFFLAPQDNGYFVLNDVFRYVEDNEPIENHPVNGIDNTPTVPSIPDSEPSHVPDAPAPDPATSIVEQDKKVDEKVDDPVETEKQLIYEKEVKVARGGSAPIKVYVPTGTAKVTPKKPENQSVSVAPATEPEASVPSSNETPESSNAQEEAEGHSIYIRNLPYNMMPAQLEVEFKKFGPIKQGGVQVRYNKQQGYCFGFVEFHSLSSMRSAIQASPMTVGGHQVVIEIKRTTTRAVDAVGSSGRGRFPSGKAGFHSDSFRSRANFGGGWGYGRNEFGNRGEFSGRGRSSSGRGEGYQQGRGRGGRSSGAKHNH